MYDFKEGKGRLEKSVTFDEADSRHTAARSQVGDRFSKHLLGTQTLDIVERDAKIESQTFSHACHRALAYLKSGIPEDRFSFGK